jgi:hypothetical protein
MKGTGPIDEGLSRDRIDLGSPAEGVRETAPWLGSGGCAEHGAPDQRAAFHVVQVLPCTASPLPPPGAGGCSLPL